MRSFSGSLAAALLLPLGLSAFLRPAKAQPATLDLQTLGTYAETQAADQITTAAQLTDLRPDNWAYQALANLISRYGCVAGYPNGTFQGKRPISRYEAAALLNSCLERIGEVSDELKRLMKELQPEMALLKSRTDQLEARIDTLQAQSFSTTTKLMGVSALYLNTASGGSKAISSARQLIAPGVVGVAPGPGEPLDAALTFQYSTILGLSTSFTGQDQLSIDLYTSNFQPYSSSIFGFTPNVTGTYSTRLSFDAPPYDNTLSLADLFYRFKVGPSITVKATAAGSEVSNELLGGNLPFPAAYPYIQSISRFGRFDPIYYQTLGRPGFSADWQIGKGFNLGGGYFGDFNGILGGGPYNPPTGTTPSSQAAIAQVSWFPTPKTFSFGTALTYVKSSAPQNSLYGLSGYTGSQYSDQPFGTIYPNNPDGTKGGAALTSVGINADHLSWGFGWNPLGNLYVTGDVGYARATAISSNTSYGIPAGETASIFEWNLALAWNNLFGPGNVLTFVVGNPYRVVSHSNDNYPIENTPAWHLEVSYTYRVSDHISLVPGVIYVLRPENNVNNDPIGIWSLKTVVFF